MKTLDQYTQDELTCLTPEQYQQLCLIELAAEGAPLAPPTPPVRPAVELIEPDLELVQIEGMTVTPAVANQILNLIVNEPVFRKEWREDFYRATHPTADNHYRPKFTVIKGLSEHNALINKARLTLNEANLSAYNTACEAMQTEQEKYDSVISRIDTAISEAHSQLRLVNSRKTAFNEYLELAQGNKEIATNFFYKRFGELPPT